MPRTTTLHLISGLPCAGKTTYAERLRRERGAAYFLLDRWLMTSFGRYAIDVVGVGEHVRRVYACRELIWIAASELLVRGADVILDDGFFLRADRQKHVDGARGIGAGATTHFIDTPMETLCRRLAARNSAPGDYHFEIALEALEGFAAHFEPPSADEGAELIVIQGERDG